MVVSVATRQDLSVLLNQILQRTDSSTVYRVDLDFFDAHRDEITASARARREFTHIQNKGDGTIEFGFEKYPENREWAESERGKAILALAGTLSDEEADELERWIEESRNTPGRDFDWS
jgi:hypothetical protein